MRVIDRIRVPALIITAEDDPFVPAEPFHDPKVTGNPHIDLHVLRHGGHCGFIGEHSGEDDGYWAEKKIVDFLSRESQVGSRKSEVASGKSQVESRKSQVEVTRRKSQVEVESR
jgi:hypothetical protein